MEGELVKPIVEATVGRLVDSLVASIKKRVGYFFSYRKHVTNMENKIKELETNKAYVEKHMETYRIYSKDIPNIIPSWLEGVRNIKDKVETIPTDVRGCFNVKQRYTAGKKACQSIKEIDRLLEVHSKTTWTELPTPLGKVKSQNASTSASSGGIFGGYESRMSTFNAVLEVLIKDGDFRVIGLWGIGGVGKTTMMKQLENTAKDDHLFDWVVSATISQEPNINKIQEAIAGYLNVKLEGDDVDQRAEQLRRRFEAISQNGSKKILVTLDDVWEPLKLESIGISPLADKSAGIKILMTSRIEDVCAGMVVGDDYATFPMQIMPHHEAWMLLQTKTKISIKAGHELCQVSNDIVKECDCLPLAIDVISKKLKNSRKYMWEDVLRRLRNTELKEPVFRALQVSFGFLESNDTRGVFLLCCLYREDASVPIEDLVRYVVGLKTFEGMDRMNMQDIRNHVRTCAHELRSASFLLYDEPSESVTMHDLVREFGQNVRPYSNGEPIAAMVNHAKVAEWPEKESHESFASISLDCSEMLRLPNALTCPNVTYLMLTCDKRKRRLVTFPQDFYAGMEKLKVITYENLFHPLLPTSLSLCSSRRALCLTSCELMYDLSAIGNLGSLEMLSFAGCDIQRLPSSIGQLKKLKLLDVSGCENLRIDDGVLGGLIKLEELYMIDAFRNATVSNYEELEKLCQTLTTLEIGFDGNGAQPKAVHFKNLKRFQISVGRYFYEFERSFRNTLKLKANKSEVMTCKINVLFQTTEKLYLNLQGINHLGDVSGASDFSILKILEVEGCEELVHLVDATGGKACNVFPVTESLFLLGLDNFEGIYVGSPQHPMFKNLRVLQVSDCAKLKYVLSRSLATSLVMLERLQVRDCENMEEIVHEDDDDEINEAEVIRFPVLREMGLSGLPKLVGMSKSKSVVFPQLLELKLHDIPKVTSIYGGDEMEAITSSGVQPLFLFRNKVAIPMLEILGINQMDSLREIWRPSQYDHSKDICTLRKMGVYSCNKLVNVFPTNLIPQLHHLEELKVNGCKSLEVIFDMNFEGKEINNIHQCHENEQEKKSFSSLKQIYVSNSYVLRHVRRIKGVNNFGHHIIQGFQALTSITISDCNKFQHLFAPSIANFKLEGLEDIAINECNHLGGSGGSNNILVESESSSSQENLKGFSLGMHDFKWPMLDEVKIVDCPEMTMFTYGHSTTPKLKYIYSELGKHILEGDRNYDLTTASHETQCPRSDGSSLCPTPERVKQLQFPLSLSSLIEKHEGIKCNLINLFRSNELLQLQKLEKLHVEYCSSLVEVFEVVEGTNVDLNETPPAVEFPELREMTLIYLEKLRYIWKSHQSTVLKFPKLTKVSIKGCHFLQHVFTCSMVGSLVQLQELHISDCKKMKVIVKETDVIEEDDEARSKGHMLPCLRSLTLDWLMNLKGFCLGNDAFVFPSLDTLKIKYCPKITVFTYGASTTSKLKVIDTNLGLCDAGDDPPSFIKSKIQEGGYFGYDVSEDEEERRRRRQRRGMRMKEKMLNDER